MYKGVSVLMLLLGLAYLSSAQTEPQFTQYMYNRFLFNPAYAGSNDALEVTLLHRSQYVGLSSRALATQGFNFNIPVHVASSGLGLSAVNDLSGFQRATYVSANYTYRKKFSWGKMGIGLSAGIIQTSLDGAKLRTPEGEYTGGVNHGDALLPDNMQSGTSPDFSLGVYFNDKNYFAGASVSHIAFSSAKIKAVGGNTRLYFSRTLFFTGGYEFNVSRKLQIMPSALIKSDLKKVQLDVGATFTIIDNILTGIAFRGYTKNTIDALNVILGFRYKGVQLVYSYDANVSYLTKFNAGSHEVSISYRYPLKKKESRGYFYHNPRFNQ